MDTIVNKKIYLYQTCNIDDTFKAQMNVIIMVANCILFNLL